MDLIKKKQNKFEKRYILDKVLACFDQLIELLYTTDTNGYDRTITHVEVDHLEREVTIRFWVRVMTSEEGGHTHLCRLVHSIGNECIKHLLRLLLITFPVELSEIEIKKLKEFLGKTTDEFIRLFYNYAYGVNKNKEFIKKQLQWLECNN